MIRPTRSRLVLGIGLVLLGIWFLADRTLPQFHLLVGRFSEWPNNLIGIGAILFVLGLVLGAPGMSVPAAIVAGIGGIFYYQEFTSDYSSWSYMWTLIPGFVGVGSIIAGLLGEDAGHNVKRGLRLVATSTVLFLVFSSFLGGWSLLGDVGPAVLLILLGLWLLVSGSIRSMRRGRSQPGQDQ